MTHYDTLEISARASPEVVRAAYRSLIQRFHPDRRPDDPDAAARAAAITEAYDVLSDPARREAYDQWLQAEQGRAAAPAPQARAPRSAAPAHRAVSAKGARSTTPGTAGSAGRWIWVLAALLVVGGALWWSRPGQEPGDDWLSLRQRFAAQGQTEQQLRELYFRKEELLRQSPDLRARAAAEVARDRESRTLDLLDAPLEIYMAGGKVTIPRLRLVLGSFDAATLRGHILVNREQFTREILQSLAMMQVKELAGPAGEAYLKDEIRAVMTRALGTRPEEEYRSTWFESPGRYGVVDVLLPERYLLHRPQP